jgi:hypothetical protein
MPEAVVVDRVSETTAGPGVRPHRLGRLSLALGESELRYVRLDEAELIRRIFVAVRDVEWGTAPMLVEHVTLDRREEALESSVTALCRDEEHEVELRWSGSIQCDAEGVITFAFEGMPLRRFSFGRVGLCILHPPEFAGGRYEARTSGGWIEGTLERAIAPQLPGEHGFGEPLFPAFDELVLHRDDGFGVHLKLSGDLFEFEDQRNWGDASYKTYSTPLHLGPQVAEPGHLIEQRVVITPILPAKRNRASTPSSRTTVELVSTSSRAVPEVGVVLPKQRGDDHLTGEALAKLKPAHVRVDLALDEQEWSERLRHATSAVDTIDVPIELAITFAEAEGTLEELATLLREARVRLARVLVFRRGIAVTDRRDVVDIRRRLVRLGISAEVYGGTDLLFADLNGNRPHLDGLDGVAFPLVPTVHADDDLSLIETMSVFADIIDTARTFTGDLPLAVTPVSLRERPRVDERQSSLLGAVWTLGAISGLAGAGADSITVFESSGPRGVLSTDKARVKVYPVYHVLADLCSWAGYRVAPSHVSDPLSAACMAALAPDGLLSAVVVNAHPRPNEVQLRGFPGGQLRIRRLNGDTLEQAMADPVTFREASEELLPSERIELSPFELVRLDAVA